MRDLIGRSVYGSMGGGCIDLGAFKTPKPTFACHDGNALRGFATMIGYPVRAGGMHIEH